MRKAVTASLLVVAMLLLLAAPSEATGRRYSRSGSRVFVGVGVGPYWGYPYWGYPYRWYPYYYPYYYPPYYYTPPTVIVQEPPVYIQQQPAAPGAPAPSEGPAEGYWHYCPSAKEYYPKAPTCPEPWIKVPPRQE
jgi:hypothetical protein